MNHQGVQAALELHWKASDAGDFAVEHEIYDEAAVLIYPQSGERIVGRINIQESRHVQPNKKRFTVTRIIGSGDLWITEFILSYDGKPSYAVSIMEFHDGAVVRETQYFADDSIRLDHARISFNEFSDSRDRNQRTKSSNRASRQIQGEHA